MEVGFAHFAQIQINDISEDKTMRIILDTEKKTITVPWNYSEKLKAMNDIIVEATGDKSKCKTFDGYLNEIWEYAMANSDTQLLTAPKPSSSKASKPKTY